MRICIKWNPLSPVTYLKKIGTVLLIRYGRLSLPQTFRGMTSVCKAVCCNNNPLVLALEADIAIIDVTIKMRN